MKVSKCFQENVLNTCNLEAFNYQLDPYIGCEHLCYYCYGLNVKETDWEKEIIIYDNLTEKLSQEIASLEPQTIYIGMNSDPYQALENEYYQTRKVIKLLLKRSFSVCILTKSGLVIRDIDLLVKSSNCSVGVSIAFQNEDTRQLFEKNAPANLERIKALEKLKKAGIETYCLICPVMPFITDVESIIEKVEPYCDTIWIYKLQMNNERGQNWRNISHIIKDKFPEIVDQFKEIVFSDDHKYWDRIRSDVKRLKKEKDVNIRIKF